MNERWRSRQWFISVWAMTVATVYLPFRYIGAGEFMAIVVAVLGAWGGREIAKGMSGGGGGLEKYSKFYKK